MKGAQKPKSQPEATSKTNNPKQQQKNPRRPSKILLARKTRQLCRCGSQKQSSRYQLLLSVVPGTGLLTDTQKATRPLLIFIVIFILLPQPSAPTSIDAEYPLFTAYFCRADRFLFLALLCPSQNRAQPKNSKLNN